MKKIITLILLVCLYSTPFGAEKARGVFFAVGVGGRLPISSFNNTSELGYGLNLEISYTDNEYLPIFLFAKAGFEQFPGSLSFYQTSPYSNLSTRIIPVQLGARYYFPPILENIILLIPMIEIAGGYSYYSVLHEFKPESQRGNYVEDVSKFGVIAGAGISMFLVEILASYNYFEYNQYVSIDLKVRLPLFVNF
jgi:hypothetical protein